MYLSCKLQFTVQKYIVFFTYTNFIAFFVTYNLYTYHFIKYTTYKAAKMLKMYLCKKKLTK